LPGVDQERRSQWLRGVLDLCVLGLLAGRESYGYELAQALGAAGLGPIQGGTLYPVLLRLERTGLVAAQWREGGAGPARKYYRLTAAGADTLERAGREWHGFAGQVGAILKAAVV
jgi:PadR family transcriptional regulator PadR